MAVAQMALLRH